MTATLVIIHVNDEAHRAQARKLIQSYHLHPPGVEHRTIIVCQDGQPTDEMLKLFNTLPDTTLYHRNGPGQDIGAYLEVSRIIETPLMVCFGGSTFVRRAGWMKRMVESFEKYGNGFYGPTASYQISPHLNTTGFWCPPDLLAQYPHKIVTREDRYNFEHGGQAFWKHVQFTLGLPVKMVTFDGEYSWDQWRDPALKGIYHRDDQSACLTIFRHMLNYQLASPRFKREYERLADTVTDQAFIKKP